MSDHTAINELNAAVQALLPAGVCASADVASAVAEPFEFPEEGQHLANAVVARRNEFIAGRRCARAALTALGHVPDALPKDADGLPLWPDGFVGSISHSRGLCCALAARAEAMTCIGLDLEKTTRLSPRAMERVAHPAEADFAGEDLAAGSLLFSAKEAFFKAQFPVWRAQPNFKDLAFQVDPSSQQMTVLKIADHLPVALKHAAKRMQFRYRFFGDYVVTLCWMITA